MAGRHVISRIEGINKERYESPTAPIQVIGQRRRGAQWRLNVFDYNSLKWKHTARMVMRRDGYMCQLSKRYGRAVPAEVVHHIFPVDEYPEYAYEPWNLIALSRKMHNTLHDRNTDALTAEGVALMRRTKREYR